MSLRVVELFCGIGGCAAALPSAAQVVAAVDIDQHALATYGGNFAHPTHRMTLESITCQQLSEWQADLWWMSPPCQPFTWQGVRRDLADPRTAPLLRLLGHLPAAGPRYLAMENVPGFAGSQTQAHLRQVLEGCGYQLAEWQVCATSFGLPNKRARYYLVASREGRLQARSMPSVQPSCLRSCLDEDYAERWCREDERLLPHAGRLHGIDPQDDAAVARCFTSAYGRSPGRSGSYLRGNDGRLRHFQAEEIARLLGFPATFHFPAYLTSRQKWSLVGNSLAVPVVRFVLSVIPELQHHGD